MPKPTPQQLAWQDMELTAFLHFGINTFTDKEWGDGTEDPRLFNPSALDARQWTRALKAGGFRLAILTAKHHDGFCLWPSKFTEHSVKGSPWKDGKGDVVREFADACRAERIKVGLYLSPWDRHEKTYGDSPTYNRHFLAQLRELLTDYGEVAEVWFDGACGEGPNGKKQQYDWEAYYTLIRQLQPRALIAICGPDIRWVGNENGLAREGESSVVPAAYPRFQALSPDGRFAWWPAECDTSIRPGWFYHANQDRQVKSLDVLMNIYCQSVGRNAVLLLNVPPDRRGLLHDTDVRRLAEFGTEIRTRFGAGLTETAGQGEVVELKMERPAAIDHIVLMEDIAQGERIRGYLLEGLTGGAWRELASGEVVGHKRIIPVKPVEVSAVRLRVTRSAGTPAIRRLAISAVERQAVASQP